MTLSKKKEECIQFIDSSVKQIILQGGDEEDLLAFLPEIMTEDFRHILRCFTEDELSAYAKKHVGLRIMMSFIEHLANEIGLKKSKGSNFVFH